MCSSYGRWTTLQFSLRALFDDCKKLASLRLRRRALKLQVEQAANGGRYSHGLLLSVPPQASIMVVIIILVVFSIIIIMHFARAALYHLATAVCTALACYYQWHQCEEIMQRYNGECKKNEEEEGETNKRRHCSLTSRWKFCLAFPHDRSGSTSSKVD